MVEREGNPLVKLTLLFRDGAALSQVFTKPIPQEAAMRALGQMVAKLGDALNIQLEPLEPEGGA